MLDDAEMKKTHIPVSLPDCPWEEFEGLDPEGDTLAFRLEPGRNIVAYVDREEDHVRVWLPREVFPSPAVGLEEVAKKALERLRRDTPPYP